MILTVIQGKFLEYPTPVIKEIAHWVPQNTSYIRLPYQDWESQQIYLLYGNKHKEAAKMKRQRNTPHTKEQKESPEKELNEMEASSVPDKHFKRKDAQGT